MTKIKTYLGVIVAVLLVGGALTLGNELVHSTETPQPAPSSSGRLKIVRVEATISKGVGHTLGTTVSNVSGTHTFVSGDVIHGYGQDFSVAPGEVVTFTISIAVVSTPDRTTLKCRIKVDGKTVDERPPLTVRPDEHGAVSCTYVVGH